MISTKMKKKFSTEFAKGILKALNNSYNLSDNREMTGNNST